MMHWLTIATIVIRAILIAVYIFTFGCSSTYYTKRTTTKELSKPLIEAFDNSTLNNMSDHTKCMATKVKAIPYQEIYDKWGWLKCPGNTVKSYYSQVKKRVEEKRRFPIEAYEKVGDKSEVVVNIFIERNGDLSSIYIIKSSGIELLDDNCISAICSASPFPQVPDCYESKYVLFERIICIYETLQLRKP